MAVRECCNSKVKLVRGTSLEEANTAIVIEMTLTNGCERVL
jgi:hypothetical protein